MNFIRKTIVFLGRFLLYGFAIIGFASTAVFVAMQYGWLNVRGEIEDRNDFFLSAYQAAQKQAATASSVAEDYSGRVARIVSEAVTDVTSSSTAEDLLQSACLNVQTTQCSWEDTPEWAVIKSGLEKDVTVLSRVEAETGVPARLVAAVVVPEQARFFSSNREVFKRWFEPMKLLGSLSKFSLGVSGVKQETAEQIEKYASDPTSPFYPGDNLAKLVAYPEGTSHRNDLFNRLTDENDHYFSYLYTALFIKEIERQWERAGHPINGRAEILVTIFNLGFDKSKPNPKPQVGGATIMVGGTEYTYGALGGSFYYSNELSDVFGRPAN